MRIETSHFQVLFFPYVMLFEKFFSFHRHTIAPIEIGRKIPWKILIFFRFFGMASERSGGQTKKNDSRLPDFYFFFSNSATKREELA